MPHDCLACRTANTEVMLDLGMQPVTAHFMRSVHDSVREYPLRLGFCVRCSMIQLVPPFPGFASVHAFPWLKYREPEGHLDELAEDIIHLPGLEDNFTVVGISLKDQSTVQRLLSRGIKKACLLEEISDSNNDKPTLNAPSPTDLNCLKATLLAEKKGRVDLVVARHILEHAQNPSEFIAALSLLVDDGGYLVIEVPDCKKSIVLQEYSMIWEEHSLYFTESTFRNFLSINGFDVVHFETYAYPFESVLVAIIRKKKKAEQANLGTRTFVNLESARGCFEAYCQRFSYWTCFLRDRIESLAEDRGSALYGAGHLAAAFVNFHQLFDLFEFVVDDTPEKQGLFMPKNGLEIVSPARLIANGVQLCLMGLSPQLEDTIIAKNHVFMAKKGRFYSILADSNRSLRIGSE